jgi:hypothetical protein
MSYVPSQDQVMAQLRIIIPALGTIVTALGISNSEAGSYTQMALTMVGPISYVIVAIWSFVANTRKSILLSASKPAEPGVPAPQIILPKEEAALAQVLPANVTAKS